VHLPSGSLIGISVAVAVAAAVVLLARIQRRRRYRPRPDLPATPLPAEPPHPGRRDADHRRIAGPQPVRRAGPPGPLVQPGRRRRGRGGERSTAESLPCTSTTITGNLVTAYSSSHTNQDWSDGLSVACENATVTGNTVIDATDVGIVLFRAYPAAQKSTVSGNTILNAGNPAFGGIVADPLSSSPTSNPSFAGSSINHNTLWTGPGAYYGIGLSAGSAAWFASPNIATGASFTGNTLTADATEGIAVSGMLNATVTGNTLNVTLGQYGNRPQAQIAVDPQYGSGTIQSPVTSTDVRNCIG
jgi:hypothetical protein